MEFKKEEYVYSVVEIVRGTDSVFFESNRVLFDIEDFWDCLDVFSVYTRYCRSEIHNQFERGGKASLPFKNCICSIENICQTHNFDQWGFIGDYVAPNLDFGYIRYPSSDIVQWVSKLFSESTYAVLKRYALS